LLIKLNQYGFRYKTLLYQSKKDDSMHNLKATLLLSLTTFILMASYIVYNNNHERFVFLPVGSEKSIYVFDRKNKTLNFCTSDNQCKIIALNLNNETESSVVALPSMLTRLIGGGNVKESPKGANQNTTHSPVTVSAAHVDSSNQQTLSDSHTVINTGSSIPVAENNQITPSMESTQQSQTLEPSQDQQAPVIQTTQVQQVPVTQQIQAPTIQTNQTQQVPDAQTMQPIVVHTVVAPGT
jgi:hypothetical protein